MSVKGEVRFEAGDGVFIAVFGFAAMEALEAHFDEPFAKAIRRVFPQATPEMAADPEKLAALGAQVRVADLGTVFGFALLKHHPQLTHSETVDLIDEIGLPSATKIVADSLRVALGAGGSAGGDGAAAGNPPRRRKPVKTG